MLSCDLASTGFITSKRNRDAANHTDEIICRRPSIKSAVDIAAAKGNVNIDNDQREYEMGAAARVRRASEGRLETVSSPGDVLKCGHLGIVKNNPEGGVRQIDDICARHARRNRGG